MTQSATSRDAFRSALRSRLGVLRKEDGAGITLSASEATFMLGVSIAVILGVIAGLIWLLPWGQDIAAKNDLQTVHSAEQVYFASAGTSSPRYGSGAELISEKALLASDKKVAVVANGDTFCIGTASASGQVFWMTSSSTEAFTTRPPAVNGKTPGVTTNCPTEADVRSAPALK